MPCAGRKPYTGPAGRVYRYCCRKEPFHFGTVLLYIRLRVSKGAFLRTLCASYRGKKEAYRKTLVFLLKKDYKECNTDAGEVIMKLTLQQIQEGSEEIIIRYRQMTEHVESIVRYLEGQSEKLLVIKEDQRVMLPLPEIIYAESVDGVTFLYTESNVYRTTLTLTLFETLYVQSGFFRCSKSMVLNIYRIRKLKSIADSRIDATLDNDEHIVISRRYAKQLRSILKGEA